LITHLLDLSRVGKIETTWNRWTRRFLKNALDTLSGLLEHRPSSDHRCICFHLLRRRQMTRVFTNLITNALKSTAAVSMPASRSMYALQQEYEFYVKDNGVGVRRRCSHRSLILFLT
jgi:signal transduction histidine kinase